MNCKLTTSKERVRSYSCELAIVCPVRVVCACKKGAEPPTGNAQVGRGVSGLEHIAAIKAIRETTSPERWFEDAE